MTETFSILDELDIVPVFSVFFYPPNSHFHFGSSCLTFLIESTMRRAVRLSSLRSRVRAVSVYSIVQGKDQISVSPEGWEAPLRVRRSMMLRALVCGRPDVRFRKVTAFEQKWGGQMLGQGVRKAVAIVQSRSMTADLPVSPVGIEGEVSDMRRDLHDDHAAFEKEGIQRQDCAVAGSGKQNHPGLEQAGGTDIGGSRRFDQFIETAAFRFVLHDGDECRCVDHHQTGRPRLS